MFLFLYIHIYHSYIFAEFPALQYNIITKLRLDLVSRDMHFSQSLVKDIEIVLRVFKAVNYL